MWGLGTCCVPHRAALILPLLTRALGLQQTRCCGPAFSKEEGERKALFFGPFFSCFGIQSHDWGVYLRAGVSWQRPNNALHLLGSCMSGPCCESSLFTLTASLGSWRPCDSYFIDEKTRIERPTDLLNVLHPLRSTLSYPGSLIAQVGL